MWHSRPPSPPLIPKTILNFHFDYLKASLRQKNAPLGFCFTFWAEFEGYLGGHFDAYLATLLRRIRQGGVSEFVPVELTAGLTP